MTLLVNLLPTTVHDWPNGGTRRTADISDPKLVQPLLNLHNAFLSNDGVLILDDNLVHTRIFPESALRCESRLLCLRAHDSAREPGLKIKLLEGSR